MINYQKLLKINCIISFFILLNIPAIAQPSISEIKEIMKEVGIPGIQISYSKGKNSPIHFQEGVYKYNEDKKIDAETRFQAASLTKVVTAYAFFRLMDQGLIDLDTPLLNYYKYDRLKNNPQAEKITARMILTHRTGLLNWQGDVPSDAWRATALTLQFEPGQDYMYSGEGFYFLQETIAHITNKSFEKIIIDEVLKPLNLSNSHIVWDDSLEDKTAYGHYQWNNPRRLGKYRKSNAAYTLYTTSSDYLSFINQIIINGKGLKKSTHKLMLTKAADAKKSKSVEFDDKYVPCALGMRMQINELGTAYWHTGSNPGFRCFFITYPKSKETLTVFMNSDTGFPAMKKLMQLFLPKNQTFWAYDWRQGELD